MNKNHKKENYIKIYEKKRKYHFPYEIYYDKLGKSKKKLENTLGGLICNINF